MRKSTLEKHIQHTSIVLVRQIIYWSTFKPLAYYSKDFIILGRLKLCFSYFFMFLRSLASLNLPKCFSNSNTAPAHPHATKVAVRGQQRNFGPLYNPKIRAPPSFGITAGQHDSTCSFVTYYSLVSIHSILRRKSKCQTMQFDL